MPSTKRTVMTDEQFDSFMEAQREQYSKMAKMTDKVLEIQEQRAKDTQELLRLGKNSKRAEYAAAALSGIMANPEHWKQMDNQQQKGRTTFDGLSELQAAIAFSLADAMMKAGE